MKRNQLTAIIFSIGLIIPNFLLAQDLLTEEKVRIENIFNEQAHQIAQIGKISIDSVRIDNNKLILFVNNYFSYLPFRPENVKMIYRSVQKNIPDRLKKYIIDIRTHGKSIEELIPRYYSMARKKKDKRFSNLCDIPLVLNISNPFSPTKGLQKRHIAMWQSHGLYYEQGLKRWEWQRARMFETVEDLYTQSYVLPFLVPMLENSGAIVMLPRERDCNPYEVIVDNDGKLAASSKYIEANGNKKWETGNEKGFGYTKKQYIDFENPFSAGSYRQIETTREKQHTSTIEWIPNIPKERFYAVYVSYKTLVNSTKDALYTVYHKDGKTSFLVNQTMGGGTWIYLGTFNFDEGEKGKVVISNFSKKAGCVVTADAVKFGGGMGNIARCPATNCNISNTKKGHLVVNPLNTDQPRITYSYETSNYPRYTEAARYWLQWAGMPDSIYSSSKGENDYQDDYKCRGLWVNYLAGGSKAVPDEKGLNIPIDMSLAFHSDAGTVYGDSIIGTLGIYQTASYNGHYADGSSRYKSRDLSDLIMSNIVSDVRALYESHWTRRGMWDSPYFEARVPKVPAMLLELLSHENFADMRYGLDPRFRFTVSRAIYKGILRFLSCENNMDYIVQPLPVHDFGIVLDKRNAILSWSATDDSLEATAKAAKYKVYMRIGDGDFDNGVIVKKNTYVYNLPINKVCSFKVAALNAGGESFPSEILSVGIAPGTTRSPVLVVNGFDRISAPDDFNAKQDSLAGFLDEKDHGVPYLQSINYTGAMKEFRRQISWTDDDSAGFGDSYGNYERDVIAGNSFDYPAVHGEALLKYNLSFTSSSETAAIKNNMFSTTYSAIDLILGKEKQTKIGRGGIKPLSFKTFSTELQQAITNYCQLGGRLFVSGSFLASDLWDNALCKSQKSDREFAMNVLKYKWCVGQAAKTGLIRSVASPLTESLRTFTYYNEPNSESYVVESPDAIEPGDSCAYTAFRYMENNLSAGVVFGGTGKDNYRTVVLGFPFESLQSKSDREYIMKTIINFLLKEKN